jgi:hypothetical protein
VTKEERQALGRTRRLVFQNVANGVPEERIRETLRLSRLEVDLAVRLVARKITEYLVIERQPPIPCDSVSAIRFHRRKLLGILARIGDLNLSTQLYLSKITVQAIDHPEMIEGAKRRMAEAQQ